MKQISPEIKRAVYETIKSQGNFYGKYAEGYYADDDLNIVNFLKLIWDLPAMKSDDSRFRNAEADATQHLINNDDWDTDYIFEKRFNLLAGDQKYFIKFVELVVSPDVRHDKNEIKDYVAVINATLKPAQLELAIEDYLDDEPIYRLKEGIGHSTLPSDIIPNQIPVYVDSTPEVFPSFELSKYIWDDYGYKTRYKLYYCESSQKYSLMGVVKIMKKNESVTYGKLPTKFFNLTEEYCSLGQDFIYYRNIKNKVGNRYRSFLNALRDSACFSIICDEFLDDSIFKISLLREKEADRVLQFAQYELAGVDYNEDRSFVFKAEIPYHTDERLSIKFNLGKVHEENNLNRIIALIGDNGIGKTSVLSQLAKAIVNNERELFSPHLPVFSKVIATSYSIFDSFFNIQGTSYNYVYCGMQSQNHSLMTEEELAIRRRHSVELIKKKDDGSNRLYRLLIRVIHEDIVDNMFDDNDHFSEKKYQEVHKWLSSGQTMLLNLIIEILSNIRHNTLLLIDEPEIHLHPQGITELVHIIDWLCEKYSSSCIMATHSAVIIQELLSRNVIVMDREPDGSPIIRPMRLESMGENLTTITQEIFGRDNKEPLYVKKVRKLVNSNKDIDEVLQKVQNNDVPISMPMYLLLDKMFSEK